MRLGSLSAAKQGLIRRPYRIGGVPASDSGILAAHNSAQNQRKTEVFHSPTVSRLPNLSYASANEGGFPSAPALRVQSLTERGGTPRLVYLLLV